MGVLGWTCGVSEGREEARSEDEKGSGSRGCRSSADIVTGRAKSEVSEVKVLNAVWRSADALMPDCMINNRG